MEVWQKSIITSNENEPHTDTQKSQPPDSDMNFFRAPAAARMAKILDRSLFTNTLQAALACPRDNKLLSKYRKELEKTGEVLLLHRLDYVKPNPDPAQAALGKKALVLQPKVNADGEALTLPITGECH